MWVWFLRVFSFCLQNIRKQSSSDLEDMKGKTEELKGKVAEVCTAVS